MSNRFQPTLSPIDAGAAQHTRQGVVDQSAITRSQSDAQFLEGVGSVVGTSLAGYQRGYDESQVEAGTQEALAGMRAGMQEDTVATFGTPQEQARLAERQAVMQAEMSIEQPMADVLAMDTQAAQAAVERSGVKSQARKLKQAMNQGVVTENAVRARMSANLRRAMDSYPEYADEIRQSVAQEFGEDFYPVYERQILQRFRQEDQARERAMASQEEDLSWYMNRVQTLAQNGHYIDPRLSEVNPVEFKNRVSDGLAAMAKASNDKANAEDSTLINNRRESYRFNYVTDQFSTQTSNLIQALPAEARMYLQDRIPEEQLQDMTMEQALVEMSSEERAAFRNDIESRIYAAKNQVFTDVNSNEKWADLGPMDRNDFNNTAGIYIDQLEGLLDSIEEPSTFNMRSQEIDAITNLHSRDALGWGDIGKYAALNSLLGSDALLSIMSSTELQDFLKTDGGAGGDSDPETSNTETKTTKSTQDFIRNNTGDYVDLLRSYTGEQPFLSDIAIAPSNAIERLSNPDYQPNTNGEIRQLLGVMNSRDYYEALSSTEGVQDVAQNHNERTGLLRNTRMNDVAKAIRTNGHDLTVSEDGTLSYRTLRTTRTQQTPQEMMAGQRGDSQIVETTGQPKELQDLNRLIKSYAIQDGAVRGMSYEEATSPQNLARVSEDMANQIKLREVGGVEQFREATSLEQGEATYLVKEVARESGVNPQFMERLLRTENGQFDPQAVSKANAQGLMQMLPSTFNDYLPDGDILNPVDNARASTLHVRRLYDRAKTDSNMRAAIQRGVQSGLSEDEAIQEIVALSYIAGEGNASRFFAGEVVNSIGEESLQYVNHLMDGRKRSVPFGTLRLRRYMTDEQLEAYRKKL